MSDEPLVRKTAIPRIKNLRELLTQVARHGPCWLLGHSNTIGMRGRNNKGGVVWDAHWSCMNCGKKLAPFTPTKPEDTIA